MADIRFLPYTEAAQLLQNYGIPLAPQRLVQTADEAVAAANELGYPLALKGISAQATHKSEAGLLRLHLQDERALAEAAAALLNPATVSSLEGLLVQAMVPPAVEMLAGITVDEQFGPLLALGSGGILVELLDDVVLRLPPLNAIQARRMIAATRSWPLLQGFRNHPPGDVPALVQLLTNLSRLAQDYSSHLASLDLNPVMVLPQGQGLQVVDLRVALRSNGS